jgi:hypothetical protein
VKNYGIWWLGIMPLFEFLNYSKAGGNPMEELYRIEILIAAVCFVAAAVIFGFTPWHKTMAGRGLFTVLTNFAVILVLIVTSFWIGQYPARDLVRTILYSLTAVNGVICLAFVISAQVIGARKDVTNYGRRSTDIPVKSPGTGQVD